MLSSTLTFRREANAGSESRNWGGPMAVGSIMGFVHRVLAVVIAAAVVAGCSDAAEDVRTGAPPGGAAPGSTVDGLVRCEDGRDVEAPADWYRDEPVYVANEQPVAEVQAWASAQPGFVSVGIDRAHNGWIRVAFTEQVEQRQQELEAAFPGVGVVAVEVEHTSEALVALQERVTAALAPYGWGTSSGSGNAKHVVMVDLGVMSEERLAALEAFRGEPICVMGRDPADAIADGPQPGAGEGWRLLGEDRVGTTYRTGLATDPDQYAELWAVAGLGGSPPDVDFETEIVIWFGAVYGISCPIRLDDVVVDTERALVHGGFVIPGNPAGCTADANPHAFVVAVERQALPAGPFAIQLGPEDPPRGAPEERTVVNADLSTPGAVATADQIGPDPALVVATGGA